MHERRWLRFIAKVMCAEWNIIVGTNKTRTTKRCGIKNGSLKIHSRHSCCFHHGWKMVGNNIWKYFSLLCSHPPRFSYILKLLTIQSSMCLFAQRHTRRRADIRYTMKHLCLIYLYTIFICKLKANAMWQVLLLLLLRCGAGAFENVECFDRHCYNFIY